MRLTLVNTEAAVAQEKQGTTAVASGNTEPASDAFYKRILKRKANHIHTLLTWPPIDIPVIPTGPIPWLYSQSCNTYDSKTSAAPITSKSDT